MRQQMDLCEMYTHEYIYNKHINNSLNWSGLQKGSMLERRWARKLAVNKQHMDIYEVHQYGYTSRILNMMTNISTNSLNWLGLQKGSMLARRTGRKSAVNKQHMDIC